MVAGALFVFDSDNWCSVFASVDEAAAQLEVNDVDAGEYQVFAQDGTIFEIWAEDSDVQLRPSGGRDLALLDRRLRQSLDQRGITSAHDDLTDIGNAILEADWQDRWPKRPRWLSRRLHGDGPQKL